jgi:hypothetical protein
MVIGNNTSSNAPANAQFDEIETFNYVLPSNQILANFQAVSAYDANLDGIPDIIQDITNSGPFLGSPVAVAGTIEAEQFDRGAQSNGYYSLASTSSTNYRNSRMVISPCNDMPGGVIAGYCLDQTVADEWVNYSINVSVTQQYTIDARVAGIGSGGGTFGFSFSTSGVTYTTTTNTPSTVPGTQWSDVTCVASLQQGINVMTLHLLGNATGGNVGKFNYISVYPYWPPTTVGPGSNNLSGKLTANASDWTSAANNAAQIQSAISSVTNSGGTVYLPSGTYYVAEPSPNESNNCWYNSAISNLSSKIRITGAGPEGSNPATSTTLVAYDRATTIFALGETKLGCTNFMIDTMTLAGQPHVVVTSPKTSALGSDSESLG